MGEGGLRLGGGVKLGEGGLRLGEGGLCWEKGDEGWGAGRLRLVGRGGGW